MRRSGSSAWSWWSSISQPTGIRGGGWSAVVLLFTANILGATMLVAGPQGAVWGHRPGRLLPRRGPLPMRTMQTHGGLADLTWVLLTIALFLTGGRREDEERTRTGCRRGRPGSGRADAQHRGQRPGDLAVIVAVHLDRVKTGWSQGFGSGRRQPASSRRTFRPAASRWCRAPASRQSPRIRSPPGSGGRPGR